MGYYEVLGVSESASPGEIRRCYLSLVRSNHPDLHANSEGDRVEAETTMREINAAWAVLGDVDERSAYDRSRLKVQGRSEGVGTPSFRATAAAKEAFRPFDDPPEFDEHRDRPILPNRLPWWLMMTLSALLVGGIGALVLGSLTNTVSLVDIGLIAMLAAGVSFLSAPLVVRAANRREGPKI